MQASTTFIGHRGPVYALIAGLVPDTFLSGSGDGLVVLWNVAEPDAGEVIVNVGQAAFSLCLLQESKLLLIGTEGGGLHVVDLERRQESHLYDVHRRGIFGITALSQGRVACAGGDGSLSIWQVEKDGALELLRQIPLAEEKLRDVQVTPDGNAIAVADGAGVIHILDTALYNEVHTLQAHPKAIALDTEASLIGATALAYHPNKPVLFSGGKDGYVRLWRSDKQYALMSELPAHKAGIYRIAFGTGAEFMATASRDKSAMLWNAKDLEPMARLDRNAGGHTHSVNAILWMKSQLITASDDRRIILWRPSGPVLV